MSGDIRLFLTHQMEHHLLPKSNFKSDDRNFSLEISSKGHLIMRIEADNVGTPTDKETSWRINYMRVELFIEVLDQMVLVTWSNCVMAAQNWVMIISELRRYQVERNIKNPVTNRIFQGVCYKSDMTVISGLDLGDRQVLEHKYSGCDPPCLLDSSDGRWEGDPRNDLSTEKLKEQNFRVFCILSLFLCNSLEISLYH